MPFDIKKNFTHRLRNGKTLNENPKQQYSHQFQENHLFSKIRKVETIFSQL